MEVQSSEYPHIKISEHARFGANSSLLDGLRQYYESIVKAKRPRLISSGLRRESKQMRRVKFEDSDQLGTTRRKNVFNTSMTPAVVEDTAVCSR